MELQPRTRFVDTSLLRNPALMAFVAEQPFDTLVVVPGKAAQIAKEIRDLVESLGDSSWLEAFNPTVAAKALGQQDALRAIFAEGFGADTATPQETSFCLWAGNGLLKPQDISYSNLWVSEKEVYELLKLGVRRFVVDKARTIGWIEQAGREQKITESDLQIILRIVYDPLAPDQGYKFGVMPGAVSAMARYAKSLGLTVSGIAFHIGTFNSKMYMDPERHGLTRPVPPYELFENYAKAIQRVAPICNALHEQGWIGELVDSEGSLRPAYDPEYDWRDVIHSQADAFRESFDYPIRWMIEPGRVFAPCAILKVDVTNVDEGVRAGLYPIAATSLSLYVGGHDYLAFAPHVVRLSDCLQGNVYTPQSHPRQFDKGILVGSSCTSGDQVGYREGRQWVWLPKGLKPGETLLISPAGSYTSASFGPQATQQMLGYDRGPDHLYGGFNGRWWPRTVAWEPGCPTSGAPFPVPPIRRTR